MTRAKWKKIYNVFYEGISTIIILIGIALAVVYLLGIRMYNVKSGSMGERLPVGCVCFVNTRYDYEKVQVGDIIAFRIDEGMLVTHRAVGITQEGILTRGDENENPDPDPVTKANYIGRTFYSIPHVGAALEFFHTEKGIVVLAAALILVLLAGFSYRHNKERKENLQCR